jgi:hypothetical protein
VCAATPAVTCGAYCLMGRAIEPVYLAEPTVLSAITDGCKSDTRWLTVRACG